MDGNNDFFDVNDMADVYGDLNDFDKRLKRGKVYNQNDDSSDENDKDDDVDRKDPMYQLQQKNQILMDRLYKSEKQLADMKDTYEAVVGGSENQKDKKIIELSKKNKALQLQAEGLKTKAAKAAEFALQLKKEQDDSSAVMPSPSKADALSMMGESTVGGGGYDAEKKLKELEKRMTKMRNENQEQKILLDKATRLLEREIGEIVDINELSKEESQWKGRAQKVEALKYQVKKLKM